MPYLQHANFRNRPDPIGQYGATTEVQNARPSNPGVNF